MFPSAPILSLLAVISLIAGFAAPVRAAEPERCLTPDQRRAVVASGQVVTLAKALRVAKLRRTDVVNARLCEGAKGHVYLLTIVARDGKVHRATIDAQTGKPIDNHGSGG